MHLSLSYPILSPSCVNPLLILLIRLGIVRFIFLKNSLPEVLTYSIWICWFLSMVPKCTMGISLYRLMKIPSPHVLWVLFLFSPSCQLSTSFRSFRIKDGREVRYFKLTYIYTHKSFFFFPSNFTEGLTGLVGNYFPLEFSSEYTVGNLELHQSLCLQYLHYLYPHWCPVFSSPVFLFPPEKNSWGFCCGEEVAWNERRDQRSNCFYESPCFDLYIPTL